MAIEVGTAYLSILPETDKLAPAIRKDLAGVDMGSEGKRQGGMYVGAMKKALAPMAGIVSAAAVGGFLKGAITEASDLAESVNALNVTYGENSKAVQALGEDAADALGLSNSEFNQLAVRFSGFADQIAGEGGNVVGTLDDLTSRASDFASVMNLEVNEAATLFQSGLAGETEPLRRFGIDLSAATVEAHAYASGLAEAGSELSATEKVQARYSLLMKETADTHGDFANTSDDLANVQRRLRANVADFQAELGKNLLPVLEDLSGWAVDDGIPALEGVLDAGKGLADVIGAIPDPIQSATVRLAGMAALLAGGAWASKKVVGGFRSLSENVLGLGRNADGTRRKMSKMNKAIGGVAVVQTVTTAVEMLDDAFSEALPSSAQFAENILALEAGNISDLGSSVGDLQEHVGRLADSNVLEKAGDKVLSVLTLGQLDGRRKTNAQEAIEGVDEAITRIYNDGGPEKAKAALESVADAYGLSGEELGQLTDLLPDYAEAQADSRVATRLETDATEENTEAKKDGTEAIQERIDALKEEREQSLTGERALLGYAQQQADTAETLAEGARTLDRSTQAGRDNEGAILDQIGAYKDLQEEQGFSIKRYKDQRKWLIRTAEEFGMTEKEAKDYADRLLGTPETVKTQAKFERRQAEKDAEKLRKNVNAEIAAIEGRRVSIEILTTAASKVKDLIGFGGAGGSSPHGGSGTILADTKRKEDGGIGEAAIDALRHKADGILGDLLGGTGKAGRVLPKGSYSIGMPYLGYPGHYGADYPAAVGTPVSSPRAGRVGASFDLAGSYGRFVRVDYRNGASGLFAHLSQRDVVAGQRVLAGQKIGEVGSTGNSTGPHLHYEHRRGGKPVNPASLGIFDNGGVLEPGAIAVNLSNKPEAVYNHKQFQQFADAAAGNGGGDGTRRVEMVITNWKTGEGYMREIADDTYNGGRAYEGTVRRMRGHNG